MFYQSSDRPFGGRACAGISPFVLQRTTLCASLGLLLGIAAVVPGGGHAAIIRIGETGVPVSSTTFYVGNNVPGVNILVVNDGSVLDSNAGLGAYNDMRIGNSVGVSGTVTVDGVGSQIVTTGSGAIPTATPGLFVGVNGSGTLDVINGGSVTVNRFDTTQGASGTSWVKVDGAGSNITSASSFNIGVFGSGPGTVTATAEITNGGVVNAGTSNIGSLNGSNGKVTVSGMGSALNLVTGAVGAFGRAFLNVGREQKGELNVLAGGKVLIEAAALPDGSATGMSVGGTGGTPSSGGSFTNGDGTLNIDGAGSELRIRGTAPVSNIGRQGTALVNVTGGGKLIVENTEAGSNSFVGRNSTGTGTINVIGAGSEWQAGRRLMIGSDRAGGVFLPGGTGTVNIAAGGTLMVAGPDADSIFIGTLGKLTGGGGTVVGNVTNQGTIAPGNSPGIMTVLGNMVLGAAGMVEIELGGMNVVLGEYDQLNAFDNPATTPIEGNISVDGTLKISLFGGFNPLGGSFFDVLTALDIMEGAPIYDLPALSGRHWEHAVVSVGNGREALRLSVVQDQTVAEPGSLALVAIGAGAWLFGRRRRAR